MYGTINIKEEFKEEEQHEINNFKLLKNQDIISKMKNIGNQLNRESSTNALIRNLDELFNPGFGNIRPLNNSSAFSNVSGIELGNSNILNKTQHSKILIKKQDIQYNYMKKHQKA